MKFPFFASLGISCQREVFAEPPGWELELGQGRSCTFSDTFSLRVPVRNFHELDGWGKWEGIRLICKDRVASSLGLC